ncbi:MAG: alpha-L-fucosidase [Bacteroidales bacterium]|nr:alpha-L-fucosidase [Bacteroidales bacterium]
MKLKKLMAALLLFACIGGQSFAQGAYVPSEENLRSRAEFADMKFGIFLHWGLYSMFAQGEWYLQNSGTHHAEYAKSADAFYPHRFDAKQWVEAFKDAGAKYVCFTSRHHEGFSMWKTDASTYNIVEATPFGRDVIAELADACHSADMRLHLYYSHLDWTREDYPAGRTGLKTGKDPKKADWKHYYDFMNQQLTELLTRYGKIGAIWFDGYWDHDSDSIPFDWQLRPQYDLIHRLQPACLIGNNHHEAIKDGEDIQIFERDLPGENTAGFVDKAAEVSRLPLETCQTMNGMWGYKVKDLNYKSVEDIVHLLINTSGKGANLLLNIGPQPNGELPAIALERLKGVGKWLREYGETIYGTTAGDVLPQSWGAMTRKGTVQYVHLTDNATAGTTLTLPLKGKVKTATVFTTGEKVPFKQTKEGTLTLTIPHHTPTIDYVLVLK